MLIVNNKFRFNYLSANNRDYEWGIVVTTIGCQRIAPHSQYPAPKEHPSIYEFSTDKGRILHEYQIIYILDGGGQFESAHQKLVSVNSGDFILLFPGEWHNYHPNQETGWYEHWLGFSGSYADQLVKNGFLSVTNPIINVGHSTELKNLFSMAISYTLEQPSGYQQLLSGIVQFALGLCFVQSQRIRFKNAEIVDKINHARQIMGERYNEEFSMESIAKIIGLNYTTFRIEFKKYTGLSPKSYIEGLRINHAKALLKDTDLSSKEIAYQVGYNTPYYFCLTFKKKTGMTPTEFRKPQIL